MTISPEELKAWRKACEKATPGPWYWSPRSGIGTKDGGDDIVCNDSGVYGPHDDDGPFIVLSRTALPALLDEVESLRKENVAYLEAVATANRCAVEVIRERDGLTAKLATAEKALGDAIELADEGWGYDQIDYFRKKWRVDERLGELRAALAAIRGE